MCNSRNGHSCPRKPLLIYRHAWKTVKSRSWAITDEDIRFQYNFVLLLKVSTTSHSRSQWPRGLRSGSAPARLLGLLVGIPPRAWMSACCECCVLSGRGLYVGFITGPEQFYRVWYVWVWSWILDNEEALAHWSLLRHDKKYTVQWCVNH